MNPHRLRAYIELLIVSVIWGLAAPVIKFTLEGFSPFVFLTYRFFLSSIVAIGFFAVTGFKLPRDLKSILVMVLYGFLVTTVSLGLLFLGTDMTTSIDANLISATAPIMIVVAGVVFLKERVTSREKIGVGIAFLGTLVTVIEPLFRNHNGSAGLEGNLLVLASVAVATITAIMAKVMMRNNMEPVPLVNFSFIVGLLTVLPVALLTGSTLPQIVGVITAAPLPYHLGVVFMALLSGTLAYILWHKAEKTIEVGEVGLFAYLYPVFGTPLSVFWLGEKITTPFIIGAVVIAIGVVIAEYKKKSVSAQTQ